MEDAKLIVENGHDVGNHSYSHNRMIFKTPSFIKEEINNTNELIEDLGYEKEIFMRKKYYLDHLLERNYLCYHNI